MLNKVKKIGGYPSPFVTVEEKSKKEYGLEYLKKMFQNGTHNLQTIKTIKKENLIKVELILMACKMFQNIKIY